jgi:hypothetical protein
MEVATVASDAATVASETVTVVSETATVASETVTADSGPQHMLALEQANRVRLARAALKRKVASGDLDAAEVVLSCPWEAESMSVSELLMSQKRWGRTRCRKFLTSIGMSEAKAVSSLTERQRAVLAALLAEKARLTRGNGRNGLL